MSNDEFGMSNSLNFEIQTSAFALSQSVTIDWTLREGARAKIKVMVKRILNKHDYWLPRCRRSVGLRPMLRIACLPHFVRPAGSLWLAISGFASGSVALLLRLA